MRTVHHICRRRGLESVSFYRIGKFDPNKVGSNMGKPKGKPVRRINDAFLCLLERVENVYFVLSLRTNNITLLTS